MKHQLRNFKMTTDKDRRQSVSACHEQDQLGVTVSKFGELSHTAKLDLSIPCRFSTTSFSGRWRNKYLDEVRKRNLPKKSAKKMCKIQRTAQCTLSLMRQTVIVIVAGGT
jgi:hypothetical protein